MEKIKSAFSSSNATTKLSKAFRLKSEDGVLRRSQMGNPFVDGPELEQPSLSKSHLFIHIGAIFFTFLSICTMGAVAGFQAKWFKISGGTGFVLFILIMSFILTATLMIVPIVYDRWDKLKRAAQFLAQSRSTLILHAFGTLLMLFAAFIVTISAWTAKGCKKADDDPHADLGDDYKNSLNDWCTTKKASAVFTWLSFAAWAALLVLVAIKFRREKKLSHNEPSFIPPPESNGVSYSNILSHDEEHFVENKLERQDSELAEDRYVPENNLQNPFSYKQPTTTHAQMDRPSIDAYGAFDGDGMPKAGEHSRTMQMAYTDPYAHLRQQLINPSSNTTHSTYAGNSIPPGPPAYAGYRQH
ncbi:uncharacterized protein L203_102963 [Cryptococcus depauperatus CBS 7841]|uniref:MARVEL domain-containing protein n=1 Tax=Cryptococcus depauperatus CBS 7841 TaxID=1295531 RepID=A0A1E3IPY6_9TREE|nr:hypothetical protein L203_01770 [Cryptococcus depauperatus CBS 7841]